MPQRRSGRLRSSYITARRYPVLGHFYNLQLRGSRAVVFASHGLRRRSGGASGG